MPKNENLKFVSFDNYLAEQIADLEFAMAYARSQEQKQLLATLRNHREQLHLTQQDIADKTGIKAQNISRLEHGLSRPSLETITRYAQALGGSIVFQSQH
ncbi:helix-turn-helix transcriptional regulator [Lonepinella koalarum]|uniref:helix-turn-helix domain-containing protein n=1 Tax=Lonepinella koalarum TaxID=53417 RepID=UPI0011E4152D|nr:helix-turn-helix transcriptional regulator [Lonepinella koalarum]TYG33358.1 helix-turn-helix transcriptional regulator [Lonepinella koalarum]